MKTHKLALFGNPVEHSLSPEIHNIFASQFDLKIDYKLIQALPNKLHSEVFEFMRNDGLGCNITLPHKQDILSSSIIEKKSNFVKKVNVANTLYRVRNKVIAENTDGKGFINDLKLVNKVSLRGKKILILGAGGAVPSVLLSIYLEKPQSVFIANRTEAKAVAMCQYPNTYAIPLAKLSELNSPFDLIIHASSLGHHGKSLKIHKNNIHKNTAAYDLSYGEAAKPFIQNCNELDIKCFDGKGMLIQQAALSFEKWFGILPQTNFTL